MKKVTLKYFSAIAIMLSVILTGCDKNTIDYNKFEGTTWVAEADNISFTLRFSEKSECSIMTRNDETHSVSSTTYYWRYCSDFDSARADFLIHPTDGEKEYFFFQWGSIENKKLCLNYTNNDDFNNLKEEDIKAMYFTREK